MIKNIIFDFGDVFINLDKQATLQNLATFGIREIDNEMLQILHEYEQGNLATETFCAFFKERFNVSEEDFIVAWNAILLDFPNHRLQFLKALSNSNKYRLFLLSNTNELHISWIQKHWGAELYQEFQTCFEQFYLSHEIHLRKPNAAIYEFVLNENNLKAEETFFIDDVKENTDAAEKLGIKTWNLIPGNDDVVELLTKKEFKT